MQKLIDIVKDSARLLIDNYMLAVPSAIAMLAVFLTQVPLTVGTIGIISLVIALLNVAAVLVTLVSVDSLNKSKKFDHMKSLNVVIGKIWPLFLLYLLGAAVWIVIFAVAVVIGILATKLSAVLSALVYVVAVVIWIWILYSRFFFADQIVLFEGKSPLVALKRNYSLIKSSQNIAVLYLIFAILVTWVVALVAGIFPGVLGAVVAYVLNVAVLVWVAVTIRYFVYKEAVKLSGK